MLARVATAAETVACEQATINAGTPATELMERAGRAAALEIVRRFRLVLPAGVTVYTGPGNNGGDGWVVARCLAENEYPVTVIEAAPAKTAEAVAAEESAGAPVDEVSAEDGSRPEVASVANAAIIVDALLGTGSTGAPRGTVAAAVEMINAARDEGAVVVSLDLPSGLDATTGEHESSVIADFTLTFGLLKRGHLLAREVCGETTVLEIGLVQESLRPLPALIGRDWVSERIPDIPANAHKGTRGRLSIIAGGRGMAGAAILSGKGALRSGIGLLRLVVGRENIIAIHAGLPEAIASEWPEDPGSLAVLIQNTDALAIGPGLGNSAATRDLVERVLAAWSGPVVVDADAINVFAGDSGSLATLLRGRQAVLTPHPAELGRLLGRDTAEVSRNRFEIGADFARESGAAVLLKGSPTVIFAPDGTRFVSAAGTAALATGGSGDVLTGIVGTLLAQSVLKTDGNPEASGIPGSVAEIAAVAAFIHGRAAELCGPVRGTTLDDILLALPDAWNESLASLPPDVLACIPAEP